MSSSEINDDDDDKKRKDLKTTTEKKASHFSRSFSDSVRHSSEQKRKQNSNLFLINLLRFRGFGGEDTGLGGLNEEKKRSRRPKIRPPREQSRHRRRPRARTRGEYSRESARSWSEREFN